MKPSTMIADIPGINITCFFKKKSKLTLSLPELFLLNGRDIPGLNGRDILSEFLSVHKKMPVLCFKLILLDLDLLMDYITFIIRNKSYKNVCN